MECVGSGITTVGDTMSARAGHARERRSFGLRACAFAEVFGVDGLAVQGVLRNLDQRGAFRSKPVPSRAGSLTPLHGFQ